MARRSEFGDELEGFGAEVTAQRPAACAVCETMLPEAVDGTLSAAEQRVFEAHVAGCTACSRELAEAQRGAAWLGMLKGTPPEPPAHLLAKILAGTSEAVAVRAAALASPPMRGETAHGWGTQGGGGTAHVPESGHGAPELVPGSIHGFGPGSVPGFGPGLEGARADQRRTPGWGARMSGLFGKLGSVFSMEHAHSVFQPRLAMTAAMAFFSIALTLNLTGVHLSSLHAEDFTPAGLRRTVADTTASLTRTFQNDRTVYQVESRLSEMDRDDGPGQEGGAGR